MAQCISPRSSAHMILKMVVHGHMLWKMGVSQPTFFKWSLTSRELLLSQATNHWFLASQWQQGRENVDCINCSIQILLEAVEILVSVSNISSMKTGSSVFASFLKNLLPLRKVNVAELFFEIVNCSCLKPPVTDSLLRSGSWEENMLASPFNLAGGRVGPPFSVQHPALICYQNAKPVSNHYTKNMCHSRF